MASVSFQGDFQVYKGQGLPSPANQRLHAVNIEGYFILAKLSFLSLEESQPKALWLPELLLWPAADRGLDAPTLPVELQRKGIGCHSCPTPIPARFAWPLTPHRVAVAVQGIVAGSSGASSPAGGAGSTARAQGACRICLSVRSPRCWMTPVDHVSGLE